MKKILALLMAVCMMLALLTGCGSAPVETPQTPAEQPVAEKPAEKETVALKVWADQVELELTEKLCNDFAAAHPEKEYVFEFGAVGAVDGKSRYLEDPAAAADVFVFADDQLIDLVKADALYEVTRNTDAIVAANTAGSINAASYDGVLYGYPMTSDNGYFLYYDKSVFTEEDLKTLDGILAAANAARKQVRQIARQRGVRRRCAGGHRDTSGVCLRCFPVGLLLGNAPWTASGGGQGRHTGGKRKRPVPGRPHGAGCAAHPGAAAGCGGWA